MQLRGETKALFQRLYEDFKRVDTEAEHYTDKLETLATEELCKRITQRCNLLSRVRWFNAAESTLDMPCFSL